MAIPKTSPYDFSAIEPKWQKKWRSEKLYEPGIEGAKKPFYNLMMFPYPSAEGLHVGNMYAFTGTDIYGRMKRMQGYDVFEPIGLDGFGIHSENYALKIGAHPMEQAKVSEERFYKQLESIGNGFAWEERLETYAPDYYRWTQWLFVKLFKAGLAYRKKQAVNWCPSCKTVLADEQVVSGACERCGTEAIKKDLEQWFFRITKYAERLLKNLETLDWSEKVRIAQRNWIGASEGALLKFPLVGITGQADGTHSVEVFTTRPDTLFGATFMVVSPELAREWLDVGWQAGEEVKGYIKTALANRAKVAEDTEKEKTGVFSGIYAVNPANQEKLPVWVADYVLPGYGTGAIMAVPAHDERDFEFAKKYKLPVVEVVMRPSGVPEGLYVGEGAMMNSGDFNGLDSREAKWKIAEFVKGERQTQYRLRDWLISRQRYWGPPIPMIFCPTCAGAKKGERSEMPGWYAAPEETLPVLLPHIKDFRPTGKDESPLASHKEFYETKCPGCGGAARRETDVSDTFLDSAWYYLRYLDPKNEKEFLAPALAKKWLPVDMYIGGAEHSVLHLLYVRFLALALHDMSLLSFGESKAAPGEPFPCFRAHGLLVKDGAKMSKSKGNVVNPDEYIARVGADALRTYLMFLAPFEQGGDFRDAAVLGVVRFLERVWKFAHGLPENASGSPESARVLHQAIKKVTDDIESIHYNTAVSALMIALNEFEKTPPSRAEFGEYLKLLAPFAPHMTEELWREVLGHTDSIHRALWPTHDESLLRADVYALVVQVNGKMRDSFEVPVGIVEDEARVQALAREKVKTFVSGEPKKTIFVPGRLINFVV